MSISLALTTALAQAAPAAQQATGDDRQWMVFAIIAFGAALTLTVLEAFVPSGGVLGILAGICALAGIIMFFRFDTTWGMVSMAVTLIATPFVISGLLWVWPNTPIGRALTLDEQQEAVNDNYRPVDPEDPSAITVGTQGKALTELRPVGACRLNGKRIDCIAQTGMIEPGTAVKVVVVEGTTVKVRPA